MNTDRFKFRVFYRGKMYPVGAIFYQMGKVKFGKHLIFIDETESLMQCTGHKDKNGKLIYEGDTTGTGMVVCWSKNHSWRIKDMKTLESYTFLPETIEIIGNIHENPELLEEEDDES